MSYNSQELENCWKDFWEKEQVYKYKEGLPKSETFVVDTPPPTVSGGLHVGHVFSYTQTDLLVRFWRMKGKNIYYPIGWDDNGLPTERRVQNLYGVSCDPSLLPLTKEEFESLVPLSSPAKILKPISRADFLELCKKQTLLDEEKYEQLWRRLGLSFDWSLQYSTISPQARRLSQASFLDLVAQNKAYQSLDPTL